ncbi:unnamed protein product [Albugo candida]|uniref:Uncharacterized protein n=1 Tax=Albugo candida TaxID=65357 RepID=A0A024G3F0_9STRA|nr:unnamed protein product [Albugo candida]|eukprot:CCI41196.1 unnamed protein product [Albugo candida]
MLLLLWMLPCFAEAVESAKEQTTMPEPAVKKQQLLENGDVVHAILDEVGHDHLYCYDVIERPCCLKSARCCSLYADKIHRNCICTNSTNNTCSSRFKTIRIDPKESTICIIDARNSSKFELVATALIASMRRRCGRCRRLFVS